VCAFSVPRKHQGFFQRVAEQLVRPDDVAPHKYTESLEEEDDDDDDDVKRA
jgi:hypothetical protein